jgi:hypothetical protein
MSKTTEAMTWFRQSFGTEIEAKVVGTPFNLDLLTAIAYQETGYIWRGLYKSFSKDDVLKLCVGDTIGEPKRKAFPKTKSQLLAQPNGAQMFAIARTCLEEMAKHVPGYKKSVENPDKFCHGFGIFQLDIQFFRNDPDYFLTKGWESFGNCIDRAMDELKSKLIRVYGPDKKTLTPTEMVYVAIAYNKGSADLSKGFKQGHRDGSGVYYGEYVAKYLAMATGLPGPVPLSSGLSLIIAIHPPDGGTGWQYRRMVSAAFKAGRFEIDKHEVGAFFDVSVNGADRQPVKDILANLGLQYIVEDRHKKDPVDPRIYVFVANRSTVDI